MLIPGGCWGTEETFSSCMWKEAVLGSARGSQAPFLALHFLAAIFLIRLLQGLREKCMKTTSVNESIIPRSRFQAETIMEEKSPSVGLCRTNK